MDAPQDAQQGEHEEAHAGSVLVVCMAQEERLFAEYFAEALTAARILDRVLTFVPSSDRDPVESLVPALSRADAVLLFGTTALSRWLAQMPPVIEALDRRAPRARFYLEVDEEYGASLRGFERIGPPLLAVPMPQRRRRATEVASLLASILRNGEGRPARKPPASAVKRAGRGAGRGSPAQAAFQASAAQASAAQTSAAQASAAQPSPAHASAAQTSPPGKAASKAPVDPAAPPASTHGTAPAAAAWPARAAPGYHADTGRGEDHLDAKTDARALASLLASSEVRPPLAIGVFGEWGSGKSFFMGQLQEQVAELSNSMAVATAGSKEGYCRNVVQIEFNAWHYVEGDLWASLAEHIFSNLRGTGEKRDVVEERRKEVLSKLLDAKRAETAAHARVQALAHEADKARQAAEAARVEAESVRFAPFDIAAALSTPIRIEVDGAVAKAAAGLDAVDATLEDIRAASERLESFGSRAGAWLRLAKQEFGKRPVLWIAGALAVLSAPLLALAYAASLAWGVSGISLALAVVGAWIPKRELGRFRAKLREAESTIRARTDALRAEHEEKAKAAFERAQKANLALGKAQAEADAAAQRVAAVQAEAAGISGNALLRRFIEDRANTDDYRKHLGLPALVRRDFERLTELMRPSQAGAARDELESAEATAPLSTPRIDRIVLYIDDLDRCKPERVVDVLQAVHLLLAFELFVVVVAVDSRWVSRCLRERYAEQLSNTEDLDAANPEDYLEKIFQIPYWVKPMGSQGARMLIAGLAVPRDRPSPPPAEVVTIPVEDGAAGAAESAADGASPAPKGAAAIKRVQDAPAPSMDAKREGPPAFIPPQTLAITSGETEVMARFAPLVDRSPRTVKRFLNCYRLAKVRVSERDRAAFMGEGGAPPGYAETLLLLAVIVGKPRVAATVGGLLQEAEREQLWALLARIRSHAPPTGPAPAKELDAWRQDWGDVVEAFARHEEAVGRAAPVAPLAAAWPTLARFSFHAPRGDG